MTQLSPQNEAFRQEVLRRGLVTPEQCNYAVYQVTQGVYPSLPQALVKCGYVNVRSANEIIQSIMQGGGGVGAGAPAAQPGTAHQAVAAPVATATAAKTPPPQSPAGGSPQAFMGALPKAQQQAAPAAAKPKAPRTAGAMAEDKMVGYMLSGKYQFTRLIGAGGMGSVFLAEDMRLQKEVAIKILPPHLATDQHYRDRFLREAQAAAKLEHPNIVTVFDYGEDNEQKFLYMIMQFVKGTTLQQMMDDKPKGTPLDYNLALDLMKQVLEGMAFAHRKSVVHRDIKPDNILVEEGSNRARITDFGLARISDRSTMLTMTGQVMGTPHFMSPEQAEGKTVDNRSDIYSLGCMFYYAFCGKFPYTGVNATAIILQHLNDQPKSLRSINPALPDHIERIILRMMEKDSANRYPTCESALQDLEGGNGELERPRGGYAIAQPGQQEFVGAETIDMGSMHAGQSGVPTMDMPSPMQPGGRTRLGSGVHAAVPPRSATPPPGSAAAGVRPVTGPHGPPGRFQAGQGLKGTPVGGGTGAAMPATGRAGGRAGRLAAAGAAGRAGRPLNPGQRRAGGAQPGGAKAGSGSNKMMVIILVILGALIAGLAVVLVVLSGSGSAAS